MPLILAATSYLLVAVVTYEVGHVVGGWRARKKAALMAFQAWEDVREAIEEPHDVEAFLAYADTELREIMRQGGVNP